MRTPKNLNELTIAKSFANNIVGLKTSKEPSGSGISLSKGIYNELKLLSNPTLPPPTTNLRPNNTLLTSISNPSATNHSK